MNKLFKLIFISSVAIAGLTHALAGLGDDLSRAEAVLKEARAAIGGESKIHSIQSLTVKGKYRRVMPDREISGEREFDLLLPDKFMKTDSIFLAGMGTTVTTYGALNGNESWTGGSQGGPLIIRMGESGPPTKEGMERVQRMQTQELRAEFARYLLALLLSPPQGFDVKFDYAGEAVADDGRADVIDASGPEGFSARLFLDKETHLPLMLSYSGVKPRIMTMTHRPSDNRKREDLIKEAQERAAKEGKAEPEHAEMQWRFSDYRKVGGLTLPHRITQSTDGTVNEEWEIKSFELNPQFKADKFQKK